MSAELNANENIFQTGQVLLFDKPLNWTSFDVVNKVRWLIKSKYKLRKIKVGHAGTLDPLATGLIILCTGKFTKKIEEYQAQEKEYIATIKLGATTPSFDLETEIDNEYAFDHITEEMVKEVLGQFIGDIKQVPPIFSAKKVDGKRVYERARKGEEFELAPVLINIKEIEVLSFDLPELVLRIVCSKGTYIRSFARDIGIALNSGAHLSGLKRTAIGNFSLEQTETIENFKERLFEM